MTDVTADGIMAMNPCSGYDRERVLKLWAGRDALTALDILDLEIPAEDRIWAVLHQELVPERDMYILACLFAEHAPLSWNGIEAKRRWAAGQATDRDLAGAAAAWIAAGDAARAARDAAGAAERLWQIRTIRKYLKEHDHE